MNNEKKTLNIMQWNCRSLVTNLHYLKDYVKNQSPQIVSLQSLNVRQNKLPKLEGYFYPPVTQFIKINCKVSAAIYIRNDVDYIPCTSPVPKQCLDVFSAGV